MRIDFHQKRIYLQYSDNGKSETEIPGITVHPVYLCIPAGEKYTPPVHSQLRVHDLGTETLFFWSYPCTWEGHTRRNLFSHVIFHACIPAGEKETHAVQS